MAERAPPIGRCVGACLALGLCIAAFPSSSLADDEDPPRWRISLSLGMVGQVQYAEGRGDSTFAASETFAPSVRDDPIVLVPAVPAGLQIEGPVLQDSLGMRPFFHGRVVIPIDEDRSLARQGTIPNPVEIPSPFPSSVTADAISGQGTLVRAILGVSGQLGVGVSLDLPIDLVPTRLGVSLDYLMQPVSVDGKVVRVTEPVVTVPRTFTIQNLGGAEETLLHYLGPRVELEFLVWEEGPFQLAVLGELGAFFSVGDRAKGFSASDGLDSARFEVEVDPWIVHAGVGLRIAWKGWR